MTDTIITDNTQTLANALKRITALEDQLTEALCLRTALDAAGIPNMDKLGGVYSLVERHNLALESAGAQLEQDNRDLRHDIARAIQRETALLNESEGAYTYQDFLNHFTSRLGGSLTVQQANAARDAWLVMNERLPVEQQQGEGDE